ncbi:MAG: protocatechuate 3,4-dioxygenase [Myxococcota bacterium]
MSNRNDDSAGVLSRRRALRRIGGGLVLLPTVGCGENMLSLDGSSDRDGSVMIVPDGAAQDAGADGALDGRVDGRTDAEVPDAWASGGTAAMTDGASYPDPFSPLPAVCDATRSATLGPCFDTSPARRDISEGYPGLPLRLALRVVDSICTPLEGVRVDVWHTRNSGVYSGSVLRCSLGDEDAMASLYFRGTQTTDDRGQVGFDSCFPGWYGGRAIHIHCQVFVANEDNPALITQLFFPAPLITEIFSTHVDYRDFGQPDTLNDDDRTYRSVDAAGTVEYARMTDGAMLAWKDIVLP